MNWNENPHEKDLEQKDLEYARKAAHYMKLVEGANFLVVLTTTFLATLLAFWLIKLVFSITVFEDGSFVGCIPLAVCHIGG